MSDLMLHAVLNLPVAKDDMIGRIQLHYRAVEASRRIYADNAQIEWCHSEIELLESQSQYHFETQREEYNRLEDTLVENDDLKADNEDLKALLKVALCPNNCFNSGHYGSMGESIECQFCDERTQAMQRGK